MEASTVELIAQPLVAMGLPGIIIIGLSFALYRLSGAYHEVQEKRITETREMLQVMDNVTSAMDRLAELIRDRAKG